MNSLYAFEKWVKSSRDPTVSYAEKLQAMHEFVSCCPPVRRVAKASQFPQDQWLPLESELQDVIKRNLDALPRGREPTPEELDRILQRVGTDLETQFRTAFSALALDVFKDGMMDAAKEVEGFAPEFGGRFERAYNNLLEGRGVADSFASLSANATQAMREALVAGFADGSVGIQELVRRVTDEVGTDVYAKAEMVARSESWKLWTRARREVYKAAEEERGEKFLYEFIRDLGPTPRGNKQCDVCTEIIKRSRGGLEWDDLVDEIIRVSQDKKYGGSPKWNPVRDGRENPLPHPRCRHVLTRKVT